MFTYGCLPAWGGGGQQTDHLRDKLAIFTLYFVRRDHVFVTTEVPANAVEEMRSGP